MADYPAQYFRYGYAVSEPPTDEDLEALEALEEWYFSEISEEQGLGHGGDREGLTCMAGDAQVNTGFIVGIPIRADECVADEDGHAYLGGLHVAEFDPDQFTDEIDRAKQRYTDEIDTKIREVMGDLISDDAEPSVVTASGFN